MCATREERGRHRHTCLGHKSIQDLEDDQQRSLLCPKIQMKCFKEAGPYRMLSEAGKHAPLQTEGMPHMHQVLGASPAVHKFGVVVHKFKAGTSRVVAQGPEV